MGKERMDAGRGRRSGQGVVNRPSGKKKPAAGGPGRDKRSFYLLLALLLVAGIATISYQAVKPGSQAVFTMDSSVTLVANQGHVMGSDSALVEIVEFADFECPACGQFATLTAPDIKSRLVSTGLVRYRFMDFPLDMHRNTPTAHMAAWCAADQGKFWEMHDMIFQTQDRWSTYATNRPDRVMSGLARQVGLDGAQFDTCMETRKFAGEIRSNFDEGVRRGVGSTPTFFIGNRKLTSALPYDEIKRHVDAALAQARAAAPSAPAGVKNPQLAPPQEGTKRP